uniref:Uncharacterized protein n=1 Tax=Megaselia scalaris TaxID=36166 RepID=T1GF27_MEGSC
MTLKCLRIYFGAVLKSLIQHLYKCIRCRHPSWSSNKIRTYYLNGLHLKRIQDSTNFKYFFKN